MYVSTWYLRITVYLRTTVTACLWLGFAIGAAVGQGNQGMRTDPETGLAVKVVAGSNKISAEKNPGKSDKAYDLELLEPYYVMEEKGDYYKITSIPARSLAEAEKGMVGYVKKDQVLLWPTREALHFLPFTLSTDRPAIQGWDDEGKIKKFMATGDKISFPATFEEDIKSTMSREKSLRPYPVVKSFETDFLGRTKKRIYEVLLPAAVPPEATVAIPKNQIAKAEKAFRSVTFCIVFDATGSMDKYARQVAAELNGAVRQLANDTFEDTRVGFVFFRDEGDAEPSLIVPPRKVDEAANFLESYAPKMMGGGDPAEPVLDGMYIGDHLFDWAAGDAQRGARKIMIAVLNTDAKPKTTGKIDPRVPEGLTPQQIAEQLVTDNITAFTVQAGPEAGANLITVLKRVADVTKGGFIPWDSSSIGGALGVAVKNALTKEVNEEKVGATAIHTDIVLKANAAVIPLKVLDGDKLGRLRQAGIKFNIENISGGVLVDKGFLPENGDLLDPQIKIEKDTLQHLINLFSVLSSTTIDAKDMKQAFQENIAAMAGEKPDPKDDIAKIVKKKLGIQFRTDLLSFNVEYLDGLNPKEKLSTQKRIKDAADKISDFHDGNLKDLDTLGAVWMPVGILP